MITDFSLAQKVLKNERNILCVIPLKNSCYIPSFTDFLIDIYLSMPNNTYNVHQKLSYQ